MLEITSGVVDKLKIYSAHVETPTTPNGNYIVTLVFSNRAIRTNIYGQLIVPAGADLSGDFLCQSECVVRISQLARKRLRRVITDVGMEIVYTLKRG